MRLSPPRRSERMGRRAVVDPLPIPVPAGQQARAARTDLAGGRRGQPPRRDGGHAAIAPRHRASRRSAVCLRSALVLGLALLSACTFRLELAGHRFAKGDLAAASMGLAAHERWFDRRSAEIAQAAAAPRRRGPPADPHAERRPRAARGGIRPVTQAHHLAPAGPDSPARLTATLSSRASVAAALGASESRSASDTIASLRLVTGNVTSARRSPEKP